MLHSKTLLKIGIISLILSLKPLPVTAIAQLKPVQIQKPSFTNTFIAATENQKRTALIISNSNYQKVIRLGNPVNDAIDIAQALKNWVLRSF